ncbi:hypothetical protein TNIN_47871 [Trichonephila inaurata madagascariensis]|uniref:Uncharacterized protein n=1 Tax=Trichonephila inaurata madagascariensis TaxID=2747483 RepID=A0A8X6Y5S6_9ARAC|nr:hypothetical protein TNIN_248241 [Trichonephila inaurata madagascariensis]GFY69335.1 hypothetical protein TNIN_47871 [Trichonephila inaurata madagascariensis]
MECSSSNIVCIDVQQTGQRKIIPQSPLAPRTGSVFMAIAQTAVLEEQDAKIIYDHHSLSRSELLFCSTSYFSWHIDSFQNHVSLPPRARDVLQMYGVHSEDGYLTP